MKAASISSVQRLQRFVRVTIVVTASILAIKSSAVAQSTTPPYFPSPYTNYTEFSQLEAVNRNGLSSFTFPSNGAPITVMGIVLNNPNDMLNTTPSYNTIPFNLGGEWQIFIQAYHDSTVGGDPSDIGGAEVWMGQCYGNLGFIADPNDVYANSQWSTVVADLNHPPLWPSSGTIALQEGSNSGTGSPAVWPSSGTVALQAGDVVAITSYGLEYEGMVNINQQHMISNPISITVLEQNAPLPAPTVTTLNQLQNSAGTFYFDPTRQTGAEHLQGTLVQMDGVRVLSGTWAPGNDVIVTDGSLRQMELQIGVNSNLTVAPTGAFNVVGVEDQESTDGSNQDGYTILLTDSANVTRLPGGGTFNWTGGNGSWNAAANWSLGVKPGNPGDAAILGGSLALAATVTLYGAQKVGGLIFANSNSSTSGYTLSPGASGTLTLDNSGATALLTVMSGSHSITAPLLLADNVDASVAAGSSLSLSGGIRETSSGMSLTEDGGGMLILSGTNAYSGGTTVDTGTLILASNAALPDGTSLTVGAGGTLVFDSTAIAASIFSSVRSQINPVPEPGTLVLLAVAIGGFLLSHTTRRKNRG